MWVSVPAPGCAKATLGFVVHRLRRNQLHAQPLAPARQLVRASGFRSPIFQLPAPQSTRSRLMEYGDSSPFSSAPRSAVTVRGPPQLAPAPFLVPPSGGLSFPAEAGTPAGSSHLEQAPGRPRRSTLRVDSVGRVHDSEVGTHRCGHKSASQSRRDVAKQAQGGADARNERGATLGYENNAKQKPEGLALTLSPPTSNRELPL